MFTRKYAASHLQLFGLLIFIVFVWSCSQKPPIDSGTGYSPPIPQSGHNSEEVLQSEVVKLEDVAQLPGWQREIFEQPGWNIVQDTPIEPDLFELPSREMVADILAKKDVPSSIPDPTDFPRFFSAQGKSSTQVGDIEVGEYSFGPADSIPAFGCNSDGTNSSLAGNAIEDILGEVETDATPRSYVSNGLSTMNHFSEGGSGNNIVSSVFQLFWDDDFFEHSYNAGLIGAGIGPGGDCFQNPGFEGSYLIDDVIYRRFLSEFDSLPNMNSVHLYDVLVSPLGNESAPFQTRGDSVATYQPFTFGSVRECYGGAWVVSIESTTSTCEVFSDIFDSEELGPLAQEFFTNPVYGLLLKRWQDMQLPDQSGPWESEIGVPVFGPFAHAGGKQSLNNKGAYYAWGEIFERGFIWWVDYDNGDSDSGFPNVPDEAIAYRFSGENIYCADSGEYLPLQTMYYGDNGHLSTNVVPLGWRIAGSSQWETIDFGRNAYNIAVSTNDEVEIEVQFYAQGYGGIPNDEFQYKYYSWMLGNGLLIPPGIEYDAQQKSASTSYVLSEGEPQSKVIVKVHVADEEGFGFGSSFPIVFSRTIEED